MTLYIEHKNCGCRIAGTGESLEHRLSIEYCKHHSAFDTLLADNARLRDVARAAEKLLRAPRDVHWVERERELDTALKSARSSGARGGGE